MLRVFQQSFAVGRQAPSLASFAMRSKRNMTQVSWKRKDGSDVPGLSFGDPENPTVVVIQEWWGLDDSVKAHAKLIADRGYHAVVPDLYRGEVGVEAEEAQHLMEGLDWSGAVDDVAGAVAFGAQNGKKVGVIGFCMGGALSLAAAAKAPGLACAVPCYGIPPNELADPADISIPVQGHFGLDDGMVGFSSKADAFELRNKLQKNSAANLVFFYPNAGHAFLNDLPDAIERKQALGQGEHNADAVYKAWNNIFDFFELNLNDRTTVQGTPVNL